MEKTKEISQYINYPNKLIILENIKNFSQLRMRSRYLISQNLLTTNGIKPLKKRAYLGF